MKPVLLEDEMNKLCEKAGHFLDLKLRPSDLKKSGIFAAQQYLEVLCGVTFPEGGRPWQEIQHYNKLRNTVVHARGYIWGPKNSKAIQKYVGGKKTITLHNDRLGFTKAFCHEVVDSVEALLQELYDNSLARMKVYIADKKRLREVVIDEARKLADEEGAI